MSAEPPERSEFTCDDDEAKRVDRWLADAVGLSRTQVHRLIREGQVWLDGEVPRKSEIVPRGAKLVLVIPEPEVASAVPEDLPLSIVYEDEHLLVVDKAAGMVVHPAPGHATGTMVNALLFHVRDLSGIGGTLRPGIVHRLDKDTSGLMVVAKSDRAHQGLSAALKAREVSRTYRAATWGHLAQSPVRIDAPIGRHPKERKRMAVLEGGRRAVTHVAVEEQWEAAELLTIKLETGRTHQIRVHLAHLGHPVVGDEVYGGGWERGMGGPAREWALDLHRRTPRQFLHAAALSFVHPVSKASVSFQSPLSKDLARVVAWVRSTQTEA